MTHIAIIIPLFFIVGIFAGTLTMVYGLGGGIILVPFIYFCLTHSGYDAAIAMKVAVGTSLLNVFVATFLTSYRQSKAKKVVWPMALRLIPCVILGTLLGLGLMHYFKGTALREIFIIFLIGIILNSFFNKSFKTSRAETEFALPALIKYGPVGVVVGALSVLVGIGGGLLIIPYLRHLKMTMLQASATSATIAASIAFCGTLGYAYSGFLTSNHSGFPPYTVGYVNLMIFVGIQLGSLIGMRVGKKINDNMTDHSRAKWFPVLLIMMVLLMLA